MAVPRKAAATTKKVAAKKAPATKKAAPRQPTVKAEYAGIPEDVRMRLSKDIMAFDNPDICPKGRKEFLKSIGFPVPPPTFTVSIRGEITVEDRYVTRHNRNYDRYTTVTDAKTAEIRQKIKDALAAIPDLEITGVGVTINHRYERE